MSDDIPVRLHEVEVATRENAVAVERAAGDARAAKDATVEFLPILRERSGDLQRREKFETNVNQAHDKIRDLDKRIVPLEKWKDRAMWTGIILTSLGAFLAWCIGIIKDALK